MVRERSGPLPQSSYKYYPLNDFTRRIFSHSEVYFPSPKRFNDPFDCRVRVDFRSTRAEQRKFLDQILRQQQPSLSRQQRQAAVGTVLRTKSFFNSQVLGNFVASLQDSVDRTGVFCLTEVPDNILMWAHYADSHRGVCVEFEIAANSFFARTLDVTYSSTYVRPHFLHSTPREQIEEILLTKATQWSYEREWRLIDQHNGFGAYGFPSSALRKVVLGCRMPPVDEAQLRGLLKYFSGSPTLLRAVPSDSAFSLELVPA